MSAPFVTLAEIEAARDRTAGHVRRSFLDRSPTLSRRLGHPVHLKLEHQQITGSFKLRGATNAVLSLDAEARAAGLVAVSTGNHGRALAHAARAAGCPVVAVPHGYNHGRDIGDDSPDAVIDSIAVLARLLPAPA